MSPPLPDVASPLVIVIDPELPFFDVPEDNVKSPLTPVAPEFAVLTVIEPLFPVVPDPATILIGALFAVSILTPVVPVNSRVVVLVIETVCVVVVN